MHKIQAHFAACCASRARARGAALRGARGAVAAGAHGQLGLRFRLHARGGAHFSVAAAISSGWQGL